MGARGSAGAGRGYKRRRAAHPDTPLGRALRTGLRTHAARRRDHSARGPGGRGEMLRVRCLRGGSRGAEAVHYIGSRVRDRPPHSLACPQPALLDPVPSGPPWKCGFRSLLAAGSSAVSPGKGAVVGIAPWVQGSLRVPGRGRCQCRDAALSRALRRACGPKWRDGGDK